MTEVAKEELMEILADYAIADMELMAVKKKLYGTLRFLLVLIIIGVLLGLFFFGQVAVEVNDIISDYSGFFG